jgi:hypothetical protein
MSSTPLFDSIARLADVPTPSALTVPQVRVSAPVPTSPISAPVAATAATLVPNALVAAIDDIPAQMIAAAEREVRISPEQRALVEALGDSFIRVVVDALATELERIARAGVVRAS